MILFLYLKRMRVTLNLAHMIIPVILIHFVSENERG